MFFCHCFCVADHRLGIWVMTTLVLVLRHEDELSFCVKKMMFSCYKRVSFLKYKNRVIDLTRTNKLVLIQLDKKKKNNSKWIYNLLNMEEKKVK